MTAPKDINELERWCGYQPLNAAIHIKALENKLVYAEDNKRVLEATEKAFKDVCDERDSLARRLDSLSAAVRKAWDCHREGDMFKALGSAMDIVDPTRNAPPISAVETTRAVLSVLGNSTDQRRWFRRAVQVLTRGWPRWRPLSFDR